MIISDIQSKRAHWSCNSSKFKAPADLSHHAILAKRLSLKKIFGGSQILTILTQLSDEIPLYSLSLHAGLKPANLEVVLCFWSLFCLVLFSLSDMHLNRSKF